MAEVTIDEKELARLRAIESAVADLDKAERAGEQTAQGLVDRAGAWRRLQAALGRP